MNHIYKVIFNKATGTFMAVAEYARGQGKGASGVNTSSSSSMPSYRLTMVSAAILALLGLTPVAALAELGAGGGTAEKRPTNIEDYGTPGTSTGTTEYDAIAIADNRTGANAQRGSVVIGGGASGPGLTVAVGSFARGGVAAVAIGPASYASGWGSVAMGRQTLSSTTGSVALGMASVATGDKSISLGHSATSSAAGAIAIGSAGDGTRGYNAGTATVANAAGAIALGQSAKATQANSVALGSNATTAEKQDAGTSVGDISGLTFAGTGANVVGTVSVGNGTQVRQIQNVAAGRVTAASTDAINGSQLYAVSDNLDKRVTALDTRIGTLEKKPAGTAGITLKTTQASGGESVLTSGATTEGQTGVGTLTLEAGNNVKLTRNNSGTVNIATKDTVTFTGVTTTTLNATGNTTIGGTLTTTGKASLNGGATLNNNKLEGVAKATANTDAVNKAQLNALAGVLGRNVIFDGSGNLTGATGFGGTNANTIHEALTTINNKAGGSFFVQKGETAGANIGLTATGTTPTNGIKFIDGTNTTATVNSANGVATVKYDVDAAALANALAGDGLTVTDGKLVATAQTTSTGGTTYVGGDDITVTGNTINLKDNITVNQVNAGGVVIDAGGINAGTKKITNLAKGVAETDGVNVNQLRALARTIQSGANIGDGGEITNIANLGGTGLSLIHI